MIIIAIIGGIISFVLFFFIPWPHLSVEQGKDVGFLMTLPIIWLMGSLFFFSRSIFSLYIVNQSPILQQINLPEAQGQIISWNQFLENLGRGIGPSLSGILLVITFYDYQLTILIITLCILPGIILWSLALKWLISDTNQISEILKKRAHGLQDTQNPKKRTEN